MDRSPLPCRFSIVSSCFFCPVNDLRLPLGHVVCVAVLAVNKTRNVFGDGKWFGPLNAYIRQIAVNLRLALAVFLFN